MTYRFLELVTPNCEAKVVARRRVYRKPTFFINRQEVPIKEEVKYLGVWLNEANTDNTHMRETALKAEMTNASLQRLMPNIAGP